MSGPSRASVSSVRTLILSRQLHCYPSSPNWFQGYHYIYITVGVRASACEREGIPKFSSWPGDGNGYSRCLFERQSIHEITQRAWTPSLDFCASLCLRRAVMDSECGVLASCVLMKYHSLSLFFCSFPGQAWSELILEYSSACAPSFGLELCKPL